MADEKIYDEEGGQFQDIEIAQALPKVPYPFPIPLPRTSGLYEWKQQRIIYPQPLPVRPIPTLPSAGQPETAAAVAGEMEAEISPVLPWWFNREELRLDVDGRYPQMAASGTVIRSFRTRVEWVANLSPAGTNRWSGRIWFKDGDEASFPYTNVDIKVIRSWFTNQRRATVTYSGGGAPGKALTFHYKSPYFRKVELEYDHVTDADPVTAINTCDHPNRPPTMACENITIETVYRRSGFQVSKSGGDGEIPPAIAGANGTWSDMEMHDAMQVYWSRFANQSQWSMWTLFAGMHDMGSGLGGIMFDDIGPNHRQGTAIFTNSFISNPPTGETHPDAWVKRMKFWTAVHEMGHSFNLAHSWQKALGTPWIPLVNEPEARSFMNYPYNVVGGQSSFFADFEFRFSDGELLFMRHAPERFVQMGNADWFDHHGFEQANMSAEPSFKLELRVNRQKPIFEFLEPAIIELKLTNSSNQAQLVSEDILSTDNLTIIIKNGGKPARQHIPFAQYCKQSKNIALNTGQSIYTSQLLSTGRNGWDIAEPGYYTIQAALHLDEQDIVSNAMRIRVAPPRGYNEEYIAQDYFSEDVGRILTFQGSRHLTDGNDTLHEIADQLKDRRVAIHANLALGNAAAKKYKLLKLPDETHDELNSAKAVQGKFIEAKADIKGGSKQLKASLRDDADGAAETLGHIEYKNQADMLSRWLDDQGKPEDAEKVQQQLYNSLSKRGVLKRVLDEIAKQQKKYAKIKAA